MDLEATTRGMHDLLRSELCDYESRARAEIGTMLRLRRSREVAFREFQKEMALSELRVMVLADRFSALYLQCDAFDRHVNERLATLTAVQSIRGEGGEWDRATSVGGLLQRVERAYDYKAQLWEGVHGVSKTLAELLILHDHLMASVDRLR